MTPIATKRGNTPQTVIDKYCRQLKKRALEIDFDTLIVEPKPVVENPELTIHELAPSLDP